jgi:DNA-binding response OmpR family regulator
VRVELSLTDDDPPDTVLRVIDTGRGIAPERQDEIFERFAHSGREDSDRNGTGIGLSLVREYVDLHDGTIHLDSTPGEGSTFTVRLPLPPADPDAVQPAGDADSDDTPPMVPADATPSPTGDGAPDDDRPVLLIVEDNADVRAYLHRHLAGSYQIIEATCGAEGLDNARDVGPDLILTDLMMPKMDGIELCRKIRADDALGRTPVLLLTARAAEEDAVAGLEAGADAYVTKPFSIEELKARLRRLREAHWAGVAESPTDGLLAPNVEVTSADEAFLARVTDAIDANLSRSGFTVEDLAAEVGLSPRQLQRKLKRLTDHTAAAFVRNYRLDVAAQLLENEAGTVSEIAYEVGFGTPETFSSRFEERFDCPPSAYPEDASKTAA